MSLMGYWRDQMVKLRDRKEFAVMCSCEHKNK